MPVIGRLDEQVDKILITPLEPRPEPGPATDEPQPPAPATGDEELTIETSTPPDELPVWLL